MIRPELTVAAIAERDGHFLMVEEHVGGRLVLNQPAGHVEPGETLQAAVTRETQEESAWTFEPEACVGIYLWEADHNNRPAILRSVFCGSCKQHNPEQILDDGIVAAHWLSYAELTAKHASLRSPLVLKAIDDYLAGHRYNVDMFRLVDASDPIGHNQ